MNFDVIGFHPDNAIGIVLKLYDGKSTEDKLRLLLNNRPLDNLNSVDLPTNFASGATIDLNAGELMGLGAVVSYYNWLGESSGNTYQAVAGIEDSAKAQTENVLSDGAIWHDQISAKMPVQQVMVQGYFPKQKINDAHVVAQINKKAQRRVDYPDNCGLIVNIYSPAGEIDLNNIYRDAVESIAAFNKAFVVWYELPTLGQAQVFDISEPSAPSLTINLRRHPMDDQWRFNLDGKRGNRHTN